MSRSGLAASKRMRLSRPSEIRALLRLLDCHNDPAWADIQDQIQEVLMATVEVKEFPVKIGDAPPVYLGYEMYERMREAALERMEQALVNANAAYNDGTNTHEQILAVLDALDDARKYADVVYTLTAIPETEEDGPLA